MGIDPGLASTGFGVVELRSGRVTALEGGLIETASTLALELRLARIASEVDELLARYEPNAVAAEEIYFGRNVRTAFAVGQARGAVLVVAGRRSLPCFAYTPQQIKLAVCGSGAAGKEQVQRMVGTLLSLERPPDSDHVADALAAAICHAHVIPGRLARDAALL